jgi:regulator of protease activity HflC (stomatin/prohibitin superfamily)
MNITIDAWEKGLKFRDGKFAGILEPGRHRLATIFAKDQVHKMDMRVRTMIIQGQEILTADKATVRTTVLAKMRVADPAAAILKVDSYVGQLYGDVQLALREAVAARTLDELIAEKAVLGAKVLGALQLTASAYGVELLEVGVRDLILPGELKAQFTRVLEARKRAEADQIERREEVAATRSLANTAQLLEKNPVLMKLKILESLEKIARGGAKLVLPADFLSDKKET